jgi:hypothetical protein
MKPIASPARSVAGIRKAVLLAAAGDAGRPGAASHRAGTDSTVCSSRCDRDKSHAFTSNFMYFLGSGRRGAVAAIGTAPRAAPHRRVGVGAICPDAARRSAWFQ